MQELRDTFKALSDETRLRILKLLEHGELCVCDIVSALDMVQPKVSFHLGVLKEAGFIKDRKHGRWIHYKLDDADMFKRFLILSVLERTSNAAAVEDKKRLERFLKSKNAKKDCINLKNTARGKHASSNVSVHGEFLQKPDGRGACRRIR